jgi:predicted transcriptional regulator
MSKGAEYLKISQPTLSKYLKNKGNVETIKGYEPSFSSSIHKDVRESRWKQVEVTNVITNEVKIYPSQTIAAESLGIKQSIVSYYIKLAILYKGIYRFKQLS